MIIPFANMGSYVTTPGPTPEYGNDEYTTVLIHGESNLEDHSYVYSSDPHTIGGDSYTDGYADNAVYDNDGCISFDGTADSRGVEITGTDNSAWTFGTGDFTVEAWVKFDDLTSNRQILCSMDRYAASASDNYVTPVLLYLASNGNLYFFGSYGGTTWNINKPFSASISSDTWYHVAISREGSTFRTFLNGAIDSTWTSSSSMYAPSLGWRLGGTGAYGSEQFDGELDEVRISKGIARYTSAFTPRKFPFGSEALPYIPIYTTQQFSDIRDNPTGDYVLMNDLDFSSFGNFTPLNGFVGTFDGQNNTLDNITVSAGGTASIFGTPTGTVSVKNVRVTNADITSTGLSASIIFGSASVTNAVNYNVDNVYVQGTLTGVSHSGAFSARIDGSGGIDPSGSFTRCMGDVTMSVSSTYNGTFTGLYRETSCVIEDCAMLGSATSGTVGTFTGYHLEATNLMARCYTAFDGANVYNGGTSYNQNNDGCYYDNSKSGSGLGWTSTSTANMKLESNYSNWDFVDTWKIDANYNDGYPYLQCMADVFEV